MDSKAPPAFPHGWIAFDARGAAVGHLSWIAAAAGLGFAVAVFGASILALPRDAFVLLHVAASGPFVLGYWRWARLGVRGFIRRWPLGLIAGAAAATFSVAFVVSQPASAGPSGATLVWSIAWLGVFYGVIDALLLTVLPVTAIWAIARSWRRGVLSVAGIALASVAASIVVTAAYHLGFPEFRGAALVQPIIGNSVITLAYVLTGNRAAPIGAHIALHVASVLHAYETSVPLPPHY
jgi:hypothetical protein